MIVLPEKVDNYKKWMTGQGYSIETVTSYAGYIKIFLGKGIEINQKTTDKFREDHTGPVSSAALKSFNKYLVRKHGYDTLVLSIKFDKNKSTKKFPESITPDEVSIIINGMPNLRLKYFTIVLFELGLRISEGLKLKWEDINFVEWIKDKDQYGEVKIKKTKRGSFRTIPVKPELMKMLYDIPNLSKNELGQPIGNVIFDIRGRVGLGNIEEFISRKENTNDQNLFDYIRSSREYYCSVLYAVSKKVLGRRIHPHMFRHSKSIYLLNKGVSLDVLKEFLGHTSLTSTEIYAKASSKKIESQLKQFDNYQTEKETFI